MTPKRLQNHLESEFRCLVRLKRHHRFLVCFHHNKMRSTPTPWMRIRINRDGLYFLFSFCLICVLQIIKDLNVKEKFATFPKLNVRRCSRIVLGDNEDNNIRSNEAVMRPKGAEFILNSTLPCQEINIGDPNVRILYVGVVLLSSYQIERRRTKKHIG